MRQLGIMFFAVLVLMGCSTDEYTMQLIDRAERVMIEHPDSALNIVRSIDEETIRGDEDMAYYRLLMAEACYYGDIVVNRDSIAQPLFDYYIKSDDHVKRARALYQHALVMMYNDENVKAMYSLLESEKSLVNSNDNRLIGNVYLTKGEIYCKECLFDNALESYYIALKYFELTDLEYHITYTKYRIGEALSNKMEYAEAEIYLRSALETSIECSYSGIASLVISELSLMYALNEKYSECRNVINMYEELNIPIQCHYTYYYSCAILESNLGNRDNALYNIELANNCEDIDILEDEYYKFIVYRNLGDTQSALYWLEQNRLQQQKLILESLELPIINIQVEALEKESKLAKIYKQNVQLSYIIICIVTMMFIVAVVLYIIKKRKQYKTKVTQYIETIRELQMLNRSVNVSMSEEVYNIYKTRFTELNNLCDIYYDHHESDRQKSLVVRQLQDTIESLKSDTARIEEMERIVNLYCNNIMTKLNVECPRLSERQKRIALYSFAGFSLRAIALFMESSPVQISKDKYKIKDAIKKGNAPSYELFVSNL